MYKFEKKIKAAEEKGIRFSEGQQTYIRCARINGIDLLDHLYDRYSRDYLSHPHDEKSSEYLAVISVILSVSEYLPWSTMLIAASTLYEEPRILPF